MHFFPRRESSVHLTDPMRVDDCGQTRKCQKFPIFGRSELANIHCTLHDQARYRQKLQIPEMSSYIRIHYETETSQIYSNGSHMFPSRTNAHGTYVSENKEVKNLLPKYYKGGGGGNRCPFTNFIVTR